MLVVPVKVRFAAFKRSFTPLPAVVVLARSRFTVPPLSVRSPRRVSVPAAPKLATLSVPELLKLPSKSFAKAVERPALSVCALARVKRPEDSAETSNNAPLEIVMVGEASVAEPPSAKVPAVTVVMPV